MTAQFKAHMPGRNNYNHIRGATCPGPLSFLGIWVTSAATGSMGPFCRSRDSSIPVSSWFSTGLLGAPPLPCDWVYHLGMAHHVRHLNSKLHASASSPYCGHCSFHPGCQVSRTLTEQPQNIYIYGFSFIGAGQQESRLHMSTQHPCRN